MTTLGSVQLLPDNHDVNEVLLAFVGGTPGSEPKAWGSGVFISPGLALTACHVVQAYSDHFEGKGTWDAANAAPGFALQALQYLPGVQKPIVWHVVAGSFSDGVDIAVLQLEPDAELPRDYPGRYPTLNVEPPRIDTEVQAFGFPESDLSYLPGRGWSLEHSATGSRGRVTQCFPVQRDRVNRRYPCFEMNLKTVSGMSGGPVFDAAGHLRGIICSGFDFVEDGPPVEYASILWPSLAFDLPTPGLGQTAAETRLLHLALSGRITVIDRELLPGNVEGLFDQARLVPQLAHEHKPVS